MTSITIANLEDNLTARLSERASETGRSIEEEAHEILRAALVENPVSEKGFGTALHEIFKTAGGWKGSHDPDELIRDIYEARLTGSRRESEN